MFANSISWILRNFSLAMLILALFFSMTEWVIHKKLSTYKILFRWIVLLPLGFSGIYTFIIHAFMPDMSAAAIGWQPSPFQYEVAMADLSLGVLGILSFSASYSFRLATVISSICCLWGDASGHIIQIVKYHNFANGNAGSWLWLDLLIPFLLLICLLKTKPRGY